MIFRIQYPRLKRSMWCNLALSNNTLSRFVFRPRFVLVTEITTNMCTEFHNYLDEYEIHISYRWARYWLKEQNISHQLEMLNVARA